MQLNRFKNNFKNNIFLVLLLCFLSVTPVSALDKTETTDSNTKPKAKTSSLMPTKQEKKNIFGRFFITMIWVLGSCGAICGALIVYKRIKNPANTLNEREQDISQNLTSPSTADDAIDFVIKKF